MKYINITSTSTKESKRYSDVNKLFVPLWNSFRAGWYPLSLSLVLLLATCLNFWHLGLSGYSNLYYAAGVKSMLSSWHTFFFASFDPGGFVSVDKPPVDFWLQVLSAKLLGFNPFSLLLPQALAGVLSVALLAHLVRRSFGSLAGLLAALALTLTPISVITSRNNDVDSMLVLAILLATWAVIIAAEQGSLRWLLVSMSLVGLGFNIKMAEAYLVVPAFVLLYFFTAPRCWRTRIWHLVLAGVVLLVISLSWIIAVDLTPPTQRPYVGSSGNNTELRLAFGYNGINRLLGHHPTFSPINISPKTAHPGRTAPTYHVTLPRAMHPGRTTPTHHVTLPRAMHPGRIAPTYHVTLPPGPGQDGFPGPTRLFNKELAGQISWLLPLALIGMIALLWRKYPHPLQSKHVQGFVLWGVWFLTTAAFFSFTTGFQMYYMVMFAPSICALVGIGIATLWHEYTNIGIRGWFLPVALYITAAVQLSFLSPFPAWRVSWLPPMLFFVTFIVGIGLLVLRVWRKDAFSPLSAPFLAAALLALLLAPAIWAALPVIQNRNSAFPVAGPYGTTTPSLASTYMLTSPYSPAATLAKNTLSITDLKLLHFFSETNGSTSYLYATTSSNYSELAIIQTDKAVMTMGGYAGADRILTVNELSNLVLRHSVRYFLLPGTIPIPLRDINDWVKSSCMRVPYSAWYSNKVFPQGTRMAGLRLYDCINPHTLKSKRIFHPLHLHHVHTRSRASTSHGSLVERRPIFADPL